MSYDQDGYPIEEGEGTDWGEKARKIQKAFADVPKQADIVAATSREQSKRLKREIRRVVPPTMPLKTVQPISYDKFAGGRGKRKNIYRMFSQGKP